jgi:large subunit ribosomal protein L13
MSTYFPSADEVQNDWYVIDVADLVLGRAATRIAMVLMGKHKPDYTPFLKTGDHVVVVNAEKVVLTGNKEKDKLYRRHTGYPGGLKETTAGQMRETHPERMVEYAVQRMLPKNKVGRQLGSRLKVYAGPTHPHEAQEPKVLTVQDKVS